MGMSHRGWRATAARTMLARMRNGYRYVGDASEWPLLWIDPHAITRRGARHGIPLRGRNAVYVAGGDWDVDLPAFDDHPLVVAIADHFVGGVAWQHTAYYRSELERIERTGQGHNSCRSADDVRARWDALDKMYADMRDNGYRTLEELGEAATRDILINIGRDGRLIYETGKHRLTIARLLKIERVPVRVMVRHRAWYRYCLESIRAGSPDRLRGPARQLMEHPDIQALLAAPSVRRVPRRPRLLA
jgi:hypothetical protein